MLIHFIACAPTKFSAIWKDETYHGPPEKILVISTFQNPANRRLFEDELAKALKDRRIDAVVSYPVMPDPAVSDKDAIAVQAKAVGADAVLINRSLGTRTDEATVIGVYGGGNVDLFISTKTDVFDMKLNRLILSASAETWIRQGEPYSNQVQSYVKDLVNMLSQQALF